MEAHCALCEVRSADYAEIITFFFYSENIVDGGKLGQVSLMYSCFKNCSEVKYRFSELCEHSVGGEQGPVLEICVKLIVNKKVRWRNYGEEIVNLALSPMLKICKRTVD